MNRRRKIFILLGITMAGAIFIPVIHHYQLRATTEAYIAELKTKGEPMELAQVIPPPVPPEQNAAPFITNALSQVYLESNYTNSIILNNPPYAMNRTIPGREMIGWQQPIIHNTDGNWPTNTWDDLSTQLAGRQNDLNDFRKLIKNPTLDFNMDYSDLKAFALMSHLPQIKMAVQWLEASEFYNLHLGKTADACTDVRAMLAFVKGQTNERFEISQLVRFAIAGISASATWDILQTTNISDDDLAQLQQDWKSLEFVAPLKNAFLVERVNELQLLYDLRRLPTNLDTQVAWTMFGKDYHYKQTGNGTYVLDDERSFFQRVKDGISNRWNKFQWRWFRSYRDEVRGLQMWQVGMNATRMVGTNHSFQATQSFVNTNFSQVGFDSVKNNSYAILSQWAYSSLACLRKAVNAETARNMAITVIALKRYELRHHQLPATLEELTPDLLKTVPIDCMDGQLLRYRRNSDGTFLLYSVGENGKDDDGDPSLEKGFQSSSFYWQNPHALDWVWPQPATPEEVQSFYEHLPK